MIRSLILRTLVTNSGITALGLANSVLLSRWLGPAGRGEIAAAMLWPVLLVYLSSIGLLVSSVYFSAQPHSKPRIVFNNAIVLGLLLSVVALPVGYVMLPWLLKSQTSAVISASRLFLLVIPLSLISQFGIGVLEGRLRMVASNWLRTIVPFGYLAGTLSLTSLGRLTLINILLLHLFLNAATLICAVAVLAKLGIAAGFQVDLGLAKQMLKYGSKVHVGNLSNLANLSLDQVLMAALFPPAFLGLYVIAVSSAGLSQMFSQAVQTVATPGIAQKESGSDRILLLQGVFRPYWLISFVIMITIGALLPILIPVVFGSAFRGAVWPAEILLLGSFFVGAKQVLAGGAQALGDPWLSSKASLIAVAVTVALLLVLLPKIGIMGAAIATTTAYFAELTVVVYGLYRGHSISPVSLFRLNSRDFSSAFATLAIWRRQTSAA
jgi:O-antigen/teichoic acid export membrane protein